jgi:hypothetical protein
MTMMDEKRASRYLIRSASFLPIAGKAMIAKKLGELTGDGPVAIWFEWVDEESWHTHVTSESTLLATFAGAAQTGDIVWAYNPATRPLPGKIVVIQTFEDPEDGVIAVSSYVDDPRCQASAMPN